MKINYELSDKVKNFIKNSELSEISIGCSLSQVFKIVKRESIYYLKVAKKGLLTSEYQKLTWLEDKLSVPKVVLYDVYNNTEYLITESLKGEMICNKYYEENSDIGIKVIADSFKELYKVDISDCPFDESINKKLEYVENNVKNCLIDLNDIKEETLKRFGSVEGILNYLKENKFNDELVFSHGDISLPNIFASGDKLTGFIDVGMCGICEVV